jgi:hypothetical protein
MTDDRTASQIWEGSNSYMAISINEDGMQFEIGNRNHLPYPKAFVVKVKGEDISDLFLKAEKAGWVKAEVVEIIDGELTYSPILKDEEECPSSES